MRHALAAALLALAAALPAVAQAPQANHPSPLTALPPSALPENLRGSVVALAPDEAVWKAMAADEFVRLRDVPLGPDRVATLVLHRVESFTKDARLVTARLEADGTVTEEEIARPTGQWWAGFVDGDSSSRVMLSRSDIGIQGFVQEESGTSIIAGDRIGGTGPVVAYALGALPAGTIDWTPWFCEALPVPGEHELGQHPSSFLPQPCRQLRVAVETDSELYQRFATAANPAQAASAYVATVFAGMRTIYQADLQILPHANYLRLWSTAADPWTQTSSGSQLNEFRNWWALNMASQSRDVAMMLSMRGLGGGVAWLGTACNLQYGYSVCGNLSGYFPYPLVNNDSQNWDIMVTSHELGHNVGSQHTHDFCPAPADQCSPSGYFGSCQTAQACINNGTIMSYCHLCGGGMTNMVLNFHPFCVDAIVSYMTGACSISEEATPPVAVADWFDMFQGTPTVNLDLLANDVLVNCEAITLDTVVAVTSQGGTLTRLVGAGPGGRDTVRYAPRAGFVGVDQWGYRVREASGGYSPSATVNVSVLSLRQAEDPFADVAGLAAKYYVVTGASLLPDFSALTPYLSSSASAVNYPSTDGVFANSGRADEVGAVWTGWVRIDQPGSYTFSLTSDDGSRLKIGSTVVVLNDGLHGMVESTGSIALAAGKHAITIEFFENGGGAGCIAQLEGPGIAKAPIAADRLSRGGTLNRYDVNDDGRVDGADLGIMLGAWGTSSPRYDFNRDGTINGADLGGLLGAWTG